MLEIEKLILKDMLEKINAMIEDNKYDSRLYYIKENLDELLEEE